MSISDEERWEKDCYGRWPEDEAAEKVELRSWESPDPIRELHSKPEIVRLCYGLDVPHAIGLHPDQCEGCAGSPGRIADDPEHIGQVAADRAVFEAKAIPDRDEWKYGPRKGWTAADDPKYTGDPELDRALFVAKAKESGPRFSERVATGERADEIEAKLRTNVDPWSYSDRRIPFPWGFLLMLTIVVALLVLCMYLVVLQLPRP